PDHERQPHRRRGRARFQVAASDPARGEHGCPRSQRGLRLTETSYGGNKAAVRNARYKLTCNTTTLSSCGFYDPVSDPLEAYPLAKPASCTAYRTTWTTASPSWHYCRLLEALPSAAGF